MSDLVVRYVAGQFVPPTIDNVYKRGPTMHTDISNLNIQNSVMLTYLVQQAKGFGSAVVSRVGEATGNRSIARNAQFVGNITGDVAIIGTGFAAGGAPGFGIAIIAVGTQKGLEAFDISLERRKATIDSAELARRAGYVAVDKRSENR